MWVGRYLPEIQRHRNIILHIPVGKWCIATTYSHTFFSSQRDTTTNPPREPGFTLAEERASKHAHDLMFQSSYAVVRGRSNLHKTMHKLGARTLFFIMYLIFVVLYPQLKHLIAGMK